MTSSSPSEVKANIGPHNFIKKLDGNGLVYLVSSANWTQMPLRRLYKYIVIPSLINNVAPFSAVRPATEDEPTTLYFVWMQNHNNELLPDDLPRWTTHDDGRNRSESERCTINGGLVEMDKNGASWMTYASYRNPDDVTLIKQVLYVTHTKHGSDYFSFGVVAYKREEIKLRKRVPAAAITMESDDKDPESKNEEGSDGGSEHEVTPPARVTRGRLQQAKDKAQPVQQAKDKAQQVKKAQPSKAKKPAANKIEVTSAVEGASLSPGSTNVFDDACTPTSSHLRHLQTSQQAVDELQHENEELRQYIGKLKDECEDRLAKKEGLLNATVENALTYKRAVQFTQDALVKNEALLAESQQKCEDQKKKCERVENNYRSLQLKMADEKKAAAKVNQTLKDKVAKLEQEMEELQQWKKEVEEGSLTFMAIIKRNKNGK